MGFKLTQQWIEDAVITNNGTLLEIRVSPKQLSAYSKEAFSKGRFVLAGPDLEGPTEETVQQWTTTGAVELKSDPSLRDDEVIMVIKPQGSSQAMKPGTIDLEILARALDQNRIYGELDGLKAQVAAYEHALINVAKLAGACWADDGRPLMDSYEVADRVLDKYASRLWTKVRDLPFSDLTVDRETGEVSLLKKPTKRLVKAKKKG